MMFKQGLAKEFKNLVKKYGKSSILTKTIGYAEFFDFEDSHVFYTIYFFQL